MAEEKVESVSQETTQKIINQYLKNNTSEQSKYNKGLATGTILINKELNALKQKLENLEKSKDIVEDINDISNDAITAAKKEIVLSKANLAIEQKTLQVHKLKQTLSSIELSDLKSRSKLESKINELKKLGLNIDSSQISSKKDLLSIGNKNVDVLERELDTTKLQRDELIKQTSEKEEQLSIGKAILTDSKKILKSWVSQLATTALLVSGLKGLKNQIDTVYDSYWRLGQPIDRMNISTASLITKTIDYNKAILKTKTIAAQYGFDLDHVEDTMAEISKKVLFLQNQSDGSIGLDYKKVGDVTSSLIAFSKTMDMDVGDAISMYEDRVRRFGDSNEKALTSMSDLARSTTTFNELLGNGAVFANEIGKALLDVQQNTRYWSQDMDMLNTMMNTHVNLLIKQGKTQKQALDISKQFQNSLQNPVDLVKWQAGRKIIDDIRASIKGLNDDDAIKKISEQYGVSADQARVFFKEMKNGVNTEYTKQMLAQETFGGTAKGANATIGAYNKYTNWLDLSVLQKDFNLGDNLPMAAQLKDLFQNIANDKTLGPETKMRDALEAAAKRKGMGKEEMDAILKKYDERGIIDDHGEAETSHFQISVIKYLGKFEQFFDNPLVKIGVGLPGAAAAFGGSLLGSAVGKTVIGKIAGKGGGKLAGKAKGVIGKEMAKSFPSFSRYAGSAGDVGKTLLTKGRLATGGILAGAGNLLHRLHPSIVNPAMLSKAAKTASTVGKVGKGALGLAHTIPLVNIIASAIDAGVGAYSAGEGKRTVGALGGVTSGLLTLPSYISDVGEYFGILKEGTGESIRSLDQWTDLFDNFGGVMKVAGDELTDSFKDLGGWITQMIEGTPQATVTEEANKRLKEQGYETDLDKISKTSFGTSKEDYLSKKGINTAAGIKQYNQLQKIATANLQSKYGGDYDDEDVQGEIQRIMDEQATTGVGQLDTQKKMLKSGDDNLKVQKQMLAIQADDAALKLMSDPNFKSLDFATQQGMLSGYSRAGAKSIRMNETADGTVTYVLTGAKNGSSPTVTEQ